MALIWNVPDRFMTSNFIISGFWQKKANCASIVLIKAALLQYGIDQVFSNRRKNGHSIITLKDKRIIVLRDIEIREINRKNGIVFSKYRDARKKQMIKKLREYVHLCYAVIVRVIQLYGLEGKEFTQTSAIRLLTSKGIKVDHLH